MLRDYGGLLLAVVIIGLLLGLLGIIIFLAVEDIRNDGVPRYHMTCSTENMTIDAIVNKGNIGNNGYTVTLMDNTTIVGPSDHTCSFKRILEEEE